MISHRHPEVRAKRASKDDGPPRPCHAARLGPLPSRLSSFAASHLKVTEKCRMRAMPKLANASLSLFFSARGRRCPFFLSPKREMERREAPGGRRSPPPLAGIDAPRRAPLSRARGLLAKSPAPPGAPSLRAGPEASGPARRLLGIYSIEVRLSSGGAGYLCVNFAGRFSTKAVMPSFWSAVANSE
jgi:hypothetical protein